MCDDVTTSGDSRARRPRVYDWNTKQHFYPDIIDSDDWTRQFVRWNSARWRSSGRHQASGGAASSSSETTSTVSGVVGEQPERRGVAISLATPFRRSQFISLSWSEKRGRRGRTTRRARRRLSDPFQDLETDVDRALTAPVKLLWNASAFCRSDWKRQVSTSRTKDGGVDQRSAGSRYELLKQVTSRERARRRREFVRQRCRRYGWEPFTVDETMTQTTTSSEQDDEDPDQRQTGDTFDIPAGICCSFISYFLSK